MRKKDKKETRSCEATDEREREYDTQSTTHAHVDYLMEKMIPHLFD